jgi:hypothetical protein
MFNPLVSCYVNLFLAEVMTAAKPCFGVLQGSDIFEKISVALNDRATAHLIASTLVPNHFLFVDGSEIFPNG